ncbi:MAG: hypothetical protein LBQ94_02295 [Treponema sp.]|jgi:hypothetical protein|nr:hypothetical protein [Treponema sp.]
MAEYEKKVRQLLLKHGCHFVRHGKGDHDIRNFTTEGTEFYTELHGEKRDY